MHLNAQAQFTLVQARTKYAEPAKMKFNRVTLAASRAEIYVFQYAIRDLEKNFYNSNYLFFLGLSLSNYRTG